MARIISNRIPAKIKKEEWDSIKFDVQKPIDLKVGDVSICGKYKIISIKYLPSGTPKLSIAKVDDLFR